MKYIFILFFPIFLFASNLGDIDKGQTYYQYIVFPMTDLRGDEFTKLHTSKEWDKLFSNEAKEFKEKYSSLNDEFSSFLQSEKFKKISLDLKAFFIYYAKDSEVKPQCGQ